MTQEEWLGIKYFKPDEQWGDPSKIKYALVRELDRFRESLGVPLKILCGTQGEHVKNSFHYSGDAVDVCVAMSDRSLIDLFITAARFNFNGIGVYTNWRMNGVRVNGLHLDIRTTLTRAFWIGTGQGGHQFYVSLTEENLRRYGAV